MISASFVIACVDAETVVMAGLDPQVIRVYRGSQEVLQFPDEVCRWVTHLLPHRSIRAGPADGLRTAPIAWRTVDRPAAGRLEMLSWRLDEALSGRPIPASATDDRIAGAAADAPFLAGIRVDLDSSTDHGRLG